MDPDVQDSETTIVTQEATEKQSVLQLMNWSHQMETNKKNSTQL